MPSHFLFIDQPIEVTVFDFRSHPMWAWMLVGLATGWLTGFALRSRGLGCVADIALGFAGGLGAGWLFTNYNILRGDFRISLAAAALGAFLLVAMARFFGGEQRK
jgi:uncharacterized membrane protein YeaQ/YmgE (transglycosylase-associated protein family)